MKRKNVWNHAQENQQITCTWPSRTGKSIDWSNPKLPSLFKAVRNWVIELTRLMITTSEKCGGWLCSPRVQLWLKMGDRLTVKTPQLHQVFRTTWITLNHKPNRARNYEETCPWLLLTKGMKNSMARWKCSRGSWDRRVWQPTRSWGCWKTTIRTSKPTMSYYNTTKRYSNKSNLKISNRVPESIRSTSLPIGAWCHVLGNTTQIKRMYWGRCETPTSTASMPLNSRPLRASRCSAKSTPVYAIMSSVP